MSLSFYHAYVNNIKPWGITSVAMYATLLRTILVKRLVERNEYENYQLHSAPGRFYDNISPSFSNE